jgi:hypothetical protein
LRANGSALSVLGVILTKSNFLATNVVDDGETGLALNTLAKLIRELAVNRIRVTLTIIVDIRAFQTVHTNIIGQHETVNTLDTGEICRRVYCAILHSPVTESISEEKSTYALCT